MDFLGNVNEFKESSNVIIPGIGDGLFHSNHYSGSDLEDGEIMDDNSAAAILNKPIINLTIYEPFSTGQDEDWRVNPPVWKHKANSQSSHSDGEIVSEASDQEECELRRQALLATCMKRLAKICPESNATALITEIDNELVMSPVIQRNDSSPLSFASTINEEAIYNRVTVNDNQIVASSNPIQNSRASIPFFPHPGHEPVLHNSFGLSSGHVTEVPLMQPLFESHSNNIDEWLWFRKTQEFVDPLARVSSSNKDEDFLSSADSEFFFLGASYSTSTRTVDPINGNTDSPMKVSPTKMTFDGGIRIDEPCCKKKRVRRKKRSKPAMKQTVATPIIEASQNLPLELDDSAEQNDLEKQFRERALQSLLVHRRQQSSVRKISISQTKIQKDHSADPILSTSSQLQFSTPLKISIQNNKATSTPPTELFQPSSDESPLQVSSQPILSTLSKNPSHSERSITVDSRSRFTLITRNVSSTFKSKISHSQPILSPKRRIVRTATFSQSSLPTHQTVPTGRIQHLNKYSLTTVPYQFIKKPIPSRTLVPPNSTNSLSFSQGSSKPNRERANKYKWTAMAQKAQKSSTIVNIHKTTLSEPFVIRLESSDDENVEDYFMVSPTSQSIKLVTPPSTQRDQSESSPHLIKNPTIPTPLNSVKRKVAAARERMIQLQQLRLAQLKRNYSLKRYHTMRHEVEKQQKVLVHLSQRIHTIQMELKSLVKQRTKVRSTLPSLMKHVNVCRKQWTAQCSITSRWELALKLKRNCPPTHPKEISARAICFKDKEKKMNKSKKQRKMIDECQSQLNLLLPSSILPLQDTQTVLAASVFSESSQTSNIQVSTAHPMMTRLNPFQPICPILIKKGNCSVPSCPNQHPGPLQNHDALTNQSQQYPTLKKVPKVGLHGAKSTQKRRISTLSRKKVVSPVTNKISRSTAVRSSIGNPVYQERSLPDSGLLSHLKCNVCDGQRIPISTRHLMEEEDCSSCVQNTLLSTSSVSACLTLLHHLHFRHIYQQSRLLSRLNSKPALNLLQENILRLMSQRIHVDNASIVKHYIFGLLLSNKRYEAFQSLFDSISYAPSVVNWCAERLFHYEDQVTLLLNGVQRNESQLVQLEVTTMLVTLCRVKYLAGDSKGALSVLQDMLMLSSHHKDISKQPLRLWRLYLHWCLQSENSSFPLDFPHSSQIYPPTAYRNCQRSFQHFLGEFSEAPHTLISLFTCLSTFESHSYFAKEDLVDLCIHSLNYLSITEPSVVLGIWKSSLGEKMNFSCIETLLPLLLRCSCLQELPLDELLDGFVYIQHISNCERVCLIVECCQYVLMNSLMLSHMSVNATQFNECIQRCYREMFRTYDKMNEEMDLPYIIYLLRNYLGLAEVSGEFIYSNRMLPATIVLFHDISSRARIGVFFMYSLACLRLLQSSGGTSSLSVFALYKEILYFLQQFTQPGVPLSHYGPLLWLIIYIGSHQHACSQDDNLNLFQFDPLKLVEIFRPFGNLRQLSCSDMTSLRHIVSTLLESPWRMQYSVSIFMDFLLELIDIFSFSTCFVIICCESLWHAGFPDNALQVCQHAALNLPKEERFWIVYIMLARLQGWDNARIGDVHQQSITHVPFSKKLWQLYREWIESCGSLLQLRVLDVEMKRRGIVS